MAGVIDLVSILNKRKEEVKQVVDKNMPFAESTAELVLEFLSFTKSRQAVLLKFCDIICEALEDDKEEVLLTMINRMKMRITLKQRLRNRSQKIEPIVIKKPRIRYRRRRRWKNA